MKLIYRSFITEFSKSKGPFEVIFRDSVLEVGNGLSFRNMHLVKMNGL